MEKTRSFIWGKARSFNWYWFVINCKKDKTGRIYQSIYRYVKASNKYIKDYDKNKESLYLQYWDVNNLYGWEMSKMLPVNNYEWIKDIYNVNEGFLKNYNEEIDEVYFLEVDVQYIEKLRELHNHLPFLPERMKTVKVKKLAANLDNKIETS